MSSNNKSNPATLKCAFHVNAQWELTYETKQVSKGKGKPKTRRTKAGAVQSITHTSKGVVDGSPGQVVVFIATSRQAADDLPLAFQVTLLDMERLPSDLRTELMKGKQPPTNATIARECQNQQCASCHHVICYSRTTVHQLPQMGHLLRIRG